MRTLRIGTLLMGTAVLTWGAAALHGAARVMNPDTEWTQVGRTPDEQRFSPLTQIDTTTVQRLGVSWYSDLDTDRGQEATPIVHDGKLYVSTAWSMVKAFDAATGKPLWSYDPKVSRDTLVKACCDAVNRGVAMAAGRIFVGTLDGRLVALDAQTGKPMWSAVTVDQSQNYTITGAPRIVKDMVLIGNGGAEYGARGYLSAYDVKTGALRWRFYTVPRPDGKPDGAASDPVMAKARATWSNGGAWYQSGGGGTPWDAIVYDPKLNLVYMGTGNGSPWNHGLRSQGEGDNLFLSSIVALDADSGAYRWHFQETPGESWDFTSTQPIMLLDAAIDGRPRQLLLHAPKNGFFYVLDRKTGEFISGDRFVDHLTWATGLDAAGRPIENPSARYYKTGVPSLQYPGPIGAHSWQPWSFSPRTGLVYLPVNDIGPAAYTPAKADYKLAPIGFNVGLEPGASGKGPTPAQQQTARAGANGYLLAWDPLHRREAWRAARIGPSNGGTLATGGNVVFQGTAAGDFEAFDAGSGRKLWSMPVGTGVLAAPATYSIAGRQYVALLAGWGGAWATGPGFMATKSGRLPNVSRLIVFALDGKTRLPASQPRPEAPLNPPPAIASAEVVTAGAKLFSRYCSTCHGGSAVSGMLNPDLRHSAVLASAEAWQSVVIDGALKDQGMVSFARVMKPAEAESVRAYVIARANEDKAAQAAR